jgi:hypothetical protein
VNFAALRRRAGRDGGYAIYPSLDAGLNALSALLTAKYANASISDTMKSFAPGSDGNNPAKYAAFLALLSEFRSVPKYLRYSLHI